LNVASGKRDKGVATMRRSLAELESLSKEDPQNAVYAARPVRRFRGLPRAHAGRRTVERGSGSAREKNLHLVQGADAKLVKGHERTMVNSLLSARLSWVLDARRRLSELSDTLQENRREWNVNVDLAWSALHLLARALEAQGKYEDARTRHGTR